ncbi:Flagellar basal-body rod modification protein FlgD [Paramagnetospirillum magnetotacticum MS-1]|uniref:Basal-body rod modification protein FlgD n=1 Tax=Paramagnetospirillum magnetotacticum MS-1 TaxID=272627 RepID=A0A0C2V3J3_PARME|nr:flagellar hook capping FlgD N-terminal domain-containing protein [Paramagnetospirillum magnetotacticum]KIL99631.1 Flagellar basal-body rod modification protein FlgD [Paramagnetospirillum magnetotacticum MS-1]
MTTVGTTSNTNTSSTAATAAATGSAAGKATLGSNFNTFLTMLTTQLKHQDPLSPMDSTQFTNQLVQFSSVEQQINANSNLEKLIKLQQTAQTSQGISYLGQTVEVAGTDLPLQDGAASLTYTLPKEARDVKIVVKDSSGKQVNSITGETATGAHSLSWDGKDSSGTQLSDGRYSFQVVATAADGTAITTTSTSFGKVTKVTNDATNGTTLVMGAGTKGNDITLTMDKVVSVKDNSSSINNAQLAAANAQYQAALAQLQALQGNSSNTGSSGTSSTTK